MAKIFISYSRRDVEVVNHIVGKIEDAGISVWIDRDDIKSGKTWRVQIVQAIDACDAFVLLLSSNSAVSDNVRKEIDLAQDSGRTVFIMRLDSVAKLPAEMRYQLVGLQYIDIQKLGTDDAVNQLIDVLREHFATLKPDGELSVRQAELVIQGVDPSAFGTEKQEQLIGFISELTETPESQLQITNLTAGSVHIFVDMPALAAFELKTRALNRDRRFKQLGIKSLRLAGDKKYVNISLGILTTTATIGLLKFLWMSVPSLFPSLFGITVGKVLIIVSAIVVTTAVGVNIPYAFSSNPNPTQTATLTATSTSVPTATQTATPTHEPTFTPTATQITSTPVRINPLTGQPVVDPSLLDLPVVLVSIPNFPPSARPQAGLSFAPYVFEFYITNGEARFLAAFYGEFPSPEVPSDPSVKAPLPQVGPIRSARRIYAYIGEFFQDSCLVAAGADKSVLEMLIKHLPCIKRVSHDAEPGDMLDIARLEEIARENGRGKSYDIDFNYESNIYSDEPPSGGKPLSELDVYWSLLNQSRWVYDSLSQSWLRYTDNANKQTPGVFQPDTDRLNGRQLHFENLIVLFTEHEEVLPRDLDIKLNQGMTGNAYLFRDGLQYKIKWSTMSDDYEKKTRLRHPIHFLDENGNLVPLKPGHTWVIVVTLNSIVDEQSPGVWLVHFR